MELYICNKTQQTFLQFSIEKALMIKDGLNVKSLVSHVLDTQPNRPYPAFYHVRCCLWISDILTVLSGKERCRMIQHLFFSFLSFKYPILF